MGLNRNRRHPHICTQRTAPQACVFTLHQHDINREVTCISPSIVTSYFNRHFQQDTSQSSTAWKALTTTDISLLQSTHRVDDSVRAAYPTSTATVDVPNGMQNLPVARRDHLENKVCPRKPQHRNSLTFGATDETTPVPTGLKTQQEQVAHVISRVEHANVAASKRSYPEIVLNEAGKTSRQVCAQLFLPN